MYEACVTCVRITRLTARPLPLLPYSPQFLLFTNVEALPGFFERFLRKRLQEAFDLKGVPVRFAVRKSVGTGACSLELLPSLPPFLSPRPIQLTSTRPSSDRNSKGVVEK